MSKWARRLRCVALSDGHGQVMIGINCFVRPCPHMLRIITTDKSQGKKVVLCPPRLTRYLLCRYDELERHIILYTCQVIEVKKARLVVELPSGGTVGTYLLSKWSYWCKLDHVNTLCFSLSTNSYIKWSQQCFKCQKIQIILNVRPCLVLYQISVGQMILKEKIRDPRLILMSKNRKL